MPAQTLTSLLPGAHISTQLVHCLPELSHPDTALTARLSTTHCHPPPIRTHSPLTPHSRLAPNPSQCALDAPLSDTAMHYEFMQDYKVHIKHTDGHFEYIPYFCLPAKVGGGVGVGVRGSRGVGGMRMGLGWG